MAEKTLVVSDLSGEDTVKGYTMKISTPDGAGAILDISAAEAASFIANGRPTKKRKAKATAAT